MCDFITFFCLPDPSAGDGGGRSAGSDPGFWHRDSRPAQGTEGHISRGPRIKVRNSEADLKIQNTHLSGGEYYRWMSDKNEKDFCLNAKCLLLMLASFLTNTYTDTHTIYSIP